MIRVELRIGIFQGCYFVNAEGSEAVLRRRRRGRNSSFTSFLSRCHKRRIWLYSQNAIQTHKGIMLYHALSCLAVLRHHAHTCYVTRPSLGFWRASVFWTTKRLRIASADAALRRKPEWQSFTFILHLQRVTEDDVKMILKIDNSDQQTAFLKQDLCMRSDPLTDGGWSGKGDFGVWFWVVAIRTRIFVTADW